MSEHISHPSLIGDLDAKQLGPQPTYLPDDHPDVEAAKRLEGGEEPIDVAHDLPASCLAWALLADEAFEEGRRVDSYAYARVGYHRGLDALRGAGWRGTGPIPFSHPVNQGFLRALYALGRAAASIGEEEEAQRVRKFLTDSDPSAVAQIEAL
ncbi:DUF3151 domain-containing protein [Brevibacterium sp. 50QC2O2]|jgi:hypothetical protein|uniref:DUF3151 domain-containing protein n=1 Tax=Brevibacterium TaxID=1696 RepID=UPI00211D14C6|nr:MULTISPECIES: DUF3151 domain-containing protein [unclassified Brevibacterium]MCQ9368065.1 DUF3151 domain-containing protein [Brevibacterium sp. 91QC2O2]MCQ9385267.1 DUF3151 domain-containing protein [Brevibacterium sp. 68QC2CO]MCQ9388773.1 DUF3151 domain-containing protein [Brevibacterium sp. 50QC2O2]